jgi:DNA-directed RNA polymerase subunit RPC12/RpoP
VTSSITDELVRCPRCGFSFEAYFRASLRREHFPEMDDREFRAYIRKLTTATCPRCSKRFATGTALVVERHDDVEEWRFQ